MTTLTILSEIDVILCIYKPDIHWFYALGKALTEGQGHNILDIAILLQFYDL